uniref:Uncharacterized protein n=1 Tax=Myoviridae sp. ctTOm1 TaxID=2826657 RepID=A0A8S5N3U9_9CAUD|nr:MAG TPA: hypothetical protein [Myoviridae sp. ctTOm1]
MAAQACTAGGKHKRAVFAACEPHENVPAREGNEAAQHCPAHAGAGALQPGNKDVRHAQAAGLAARRHNAPGKHPPERERTPPGQTHRGMAKRPAAGQSAALRPTLRQTVWQRRKTRRLHPFLLKETPPSASACRLRAGAPAPHLPPRMAAQALPGTLRPHRFQSRKSII